MVTRIHRETALVLLAILGGAALLFAPILVVVEDESRAAGLALIAGCALGAACAVTLVPRLSPITAAFAGALGAVAVRGVDALGADATLDVSAGAGTAVVLAAFVAAAATVLIGMRPWAPMRNTAAALISLAVTLGAWIVPAALAQLGEVSGLPVVVLVLLGPFFGGMAAGLLVPGGDSGHVARGWPLVFGLTTVALVVVERNPLIIASGVLGTIFFCPFLSGLGALGARVVQPRHPDGHEMVPTARAIR